METPYCGKKPVLLHHSNDISDCYLSCNCKLGFKPMISMDINFLYCINNNNNIIVSYYC